MIAFGLLASCLASCKPSTAGLAPVSGKVTLDGKPLAGAHVVFQPLRGAKAVDAVGSYAFTDDNGAYTLQTFDSGQPGAAVGKHQVEIKLRIETEGNPRPRTPPRQLPARYNVQSELTFDVQPGGTKDANFDLTSKP